MLTWKSEFETGEPQIDADHRMLVDGLNQLETALHDGRGSQAVSSLLDFLDRYSTIHFAREEKCMAEVRCPVAARNVQAHEQFRRIFATARTRLGSGGATALIAVRIHRELCDWITNHILQVDSGLKACLRAKSG